jgi:hypothetical protein
VGPSGSGGNCSYTRGQRGICFISVGTTGQGHQSWHYLWPIGQLLAGCMTLWPLLCLLLFVYYLVSDFLLFLHKTISLTKAVGKIVAEDDGGKL